MSGQQIFGSGGVLFKGSVADNAELQLASNPVPFAADPTLTLPATTGTVALNGHSHSASDITSGQFQNDSLNGSDILESSLGPVPTAGSASDLVCGSSCASNAEVDGDLTIDAGGSVADSALPSNIARLNADQTFTGSNTFGDCGPTP